MNAYDYNINNICDFEKEYGLFERTYNGVHYWQMIRRQLFILSEKKSSDFNNTHSKNNFILLFSVLKMYLYDLLAYYQLKHFDILYFDRGDKRMVNGKKQDVYFDYFNFEQNYSIYRCYFSDYDRKSHKTNSICVAIPKIKWILKKPFYRIWSEYIDKDEELYIKQFVEIINDKFDIKISARKLSKKIQNDAVGFKVLKKYYSKVLKKIAPYAIFVVGYYSMPLLPLYDEAREQNIPVIELQHGTVFTHEAYRYSNSLSDGKMLPNYFFAWGEFFKNSITLPDCFKVITVGFPFAEYKKSMSGKFKQDTKAIVFFLSEMSDSEMKFETLIAEFSNMYSIYGYHILCKPHPAYKIEDNSVIKNINNIKIIPADENVYDIMATCKYHVTVSSTVLFESTLFSSQRFVYNDNHRSYLLHPLIDYNKARYFSSAEELFELMQTDLSDSENCKKVFFAENARYNGNCALQTIISERHI